MPSGPRAERPPRGRLGPRAADRPHGPLQHRVGGGRTPLIEEKPRVLAPDQAAAARFKTWLGDIEREAGHALLLALRRDPAMAAVADGLEVLKMPHHGSSNLDEGFMDEVAAPVALISVGADNDYGHPTPTALSWAARHSARVLRTDTHGDIAVLDGPTVVTENSG